MDQHPEKGGRSYCPQKNSILWNSSTLTGFNMEGKYMPWRLHTKWGLVISRGVSPFLCLKHCNWRQLPGVRSYNSLEIVLLLYRLSITYTFWCNLKVTRCSGWCESGERIFRSRWCFSLGFTILNNWRKKNSAKYNLQGSSCCSVMVATNLIFILAKIEIQVANTWKSCLVKHQTLGKKL
jgi:hypothetical protein